jgi:hypothetical protein
LLFSKLEAFFPSTLLDEYFETRHISAGYNFINLVVGQIHLFFLLVDFVNPHFLHLSWANLTCTCHSSVVFLAVKVRFNSFVEETDVFIKVCSRFVFLNAQKTGSKNCNDLLNFSLFVGHSKIESVGPNIFELVFVLEMCFCNFEVSVNGFTVITRLFPHFGRINDFLACLVLNCGSSRQVFVDLMN